MKQLKDSRTPAETRVTASVKCVIALAMLLLTSAGVEATLLSDYTFDTDASDATGLRNGTFSASGATITNDARIGSGSLTLSGGYVTLPGSVTALNGLTDFTFATWVKLKNNPTDPSGIDAIFATDNAGSSDLQLNYQAGPLLTASTGSGPSYPQTSDLPNAGLGATDWFHVALTGQGSTLKLYINSVLKDTTTTGVPVDLGNAATIGGWYMWWIPQYARQIDGQIDDLRIYDNALTPGEIAVLAQVVPEPTSLAFVVLGSGLLVWWRRRR